MMGPMHNATPRRKIRFTVFPNQFASERYTYDATLDEIANLIPQATEASKETLPWIKLALIGDKASLKGCFRTNANVLGVTGLEADYDNGQIGFEAVIERLEKHRLTALLYTTPSYTEEKPRWRILCPFAKPQIAVPAELKQFRDRMMDRLNGVFDGGLAGESWTLSQAYYFGNVEGR